MKFGQGMIRGEKRLSQKKKNKKNQQTTITQQNKKIKKEGKMKTHINDETTKYHKNGFITLCE